MITFDKIKECIDLIYQYEQECFVLDLNIYKKLNEDYKLKELNNNSYLNTLFGYQIYINDSNDFEKGLHLSYRIFKDMNRSYNKIYYIRKDSIYILGKDICDLFESKISSEYLNNL